MSNNFTLNWMIRVIGAEEKYLSVCALFFIKIYFNSSVETQGYHLKRGRLLLILLISKQRSNSKQQRVSDLWQSIQRKIYLHIKNITGRERKYRNLKKKPDVLFNWSLMWIHMIKIILTLELESMTIYLQRKIEITKMWQDCSTPNLHRLTINQKHIFDLVS